MTFRNFRAPGRYSNWKRLWYTSSIVLTKTRLVGLRYSTPIINVAFADERIHKLRCSQEESGILLIAFDSALFLDDSSGTIECRFRTTQAQLFMDNLRELGV